MWSETAFGAVARPNHRNTPWDQARFEIPVHRWADLSEPGYGVSLLNNGKYGYSAHGNVLGISLLRGPIYPDPYADEGEHEFAYAVYPHAGDWRNGTVREAEEMHSPLRITPTSGSSWPSLFRFTDESLRLASLKKAEDSEAIILRLYEPHGGRGKTTVETAIQLQKAVIVNILEDEIQELTIDDGRQVTFEFKPFQVISLKLVFRTGARRGANVVGRGSLKTTQFRQGKPAASNRVDVDTSLDAPSRGVALHHGSARHGHSRIKSIEGRQFSPAKRSGL